MKWFQREKHLSHSWKKHVDNYFAYLNPDETKTLKTFIQYNYIPFLSPYVNIHLIHGLIEQIKKENKIPIAEKYLSMCETQYQKDNLHEWLKYRCGQPEFYIKEKMIQDKFMDVLKYIEEIK